MTSLDKRRKGTQPEKMRKNIEGVSRLLKGRCIFTYLDYKDVLAEVRNSDFVYIDPPYQGVCGNRDSRYYSGINFDDFVVAIKKLNRKEIMFVVSYDGNRGNKIFDKELPEELRLKKSEIEVELSSQATLLGRQKITVESLYLSSNLSGDRNLDLESYIRKAHKQITLLERHGQFSTAPSITR
ncbi:DNA adenine methylase [uncultured Nostoc sp.]|uniref:DNA adenine methylase n=1 Tax=uncultured Nostoc sp. TaxID=340711 RepID=UPI0035CBE783